MATTDVPAAAATPGPTGHPKGSPAERVAMHASKIGQQLEALYQECHGLTGDPGSPLCGAVRQIQEAVSTVAQHVGSGEFDANAAAPPDDVPQDVPTDVPAGPPMGSNPFAAAAAGLHQDMMGSVPPGATPLP